MQPHSLYVVQCRLRREQEADDTEEVSKEIFDGIIATQPHEYITPEDIVCEHELQTRLWKTFDGLDSNDRAKAIFKDYHVEGMTFGEIGEKNGISKERCRQISCRVKIMLRDSLTHCPYEERLLQEASRKRAAQEKKVSGNRARELIKLLEGGCPTEQVRRQSYCLLGSPERHQLMDKLEAIEKAEEKKKRSEGLRRRSQYALLKRIRGKVRRVIWSKKQDTDKLKKAMNLLPQVKQMISEMEDGQDINGEELEQLDQNTQCFNEPKPPRERTSWEVAADEVAAAAAERLAKDNTPMNLKERIRLLNWAWERKDKYPRTIEQMRKDPKYKQLLSIKSRASQERKFRSRVLPHKEDDQEDR